MYSRVFSATLLSLSATCWAIITYALGLLSTSPLSLSAMNCKCEELHLEQLGWILTSLSVIN